MKTGYEQMKTNDEIKPVLVFSGTAVQAGMVKSLLENAEIEAFLKDDLMGTLNPWRAAPGGAGAVKVFVSSTNYEKAKIVVGQYESNLNKHS
jgi:hypothetical protein